MDKDKDLVDIGDVDWSDAQQLGVNAMVYSLQPEMLIGDVAIPVSNSRKGVKGNLVCNRDFAVAKFLQLLDQLQLTDPVQIEEFLGEVADLRILRVDSSKDEAKQAIAQLIEAKLKESGLTIEELGLKKVK